MIMINSETTNSSFSLPASNKEYLNHGEAVKEQGHVVDRRTPKSAQRKVCSPYGRISYCLPWGEYTTINPPTIKYNTITLVPSVSTIALTWVYHKMPAHMGTPQ